MELKIEARAVVPLFDGCLVAGYRVKNEINAEYFQSKSTVTDEKISRWQKMVNQWTKETIEVLSATFVSAVESYNFRDAQASPLVAAGTNLRWNGVINQLEARIGKLNQYRSEIGALPAMLVVCRDVINQIGQENETSIKN